MGGSRLVNGVSVRSRLFHIYEFARLRAFLRFRLNRPIYYDDRFTKAGIDLDLDRVGVDPVYGH